MKLKPHAYRFVVTPLQRQAWERFKKEQWPTESDPNFAEGSDWKECFMAGYKASEASADYWRREYQAEANENHAIRVALGVDPEDPDETLSALAVEKVVAEGKLLRELATLVARLKMGQSHFHGMREDTEIDRIFAALKELREEGS